MRIKMLHIFILFLLIGIGKTTYAATPIADGDNCGILYDIVSEKSKAKCEADCASGMSKISTALPQPSYVCADKIAIGGSCKENRNCISSYCSSGKCIDNPYGTTGTDLPAGAWCGSANQQTKLPTGSGEVNCMAHCLSGMWKIHDPWNPFAEIHMDCIAKKKGFANCTENRNCFSDYCNPTTKKCDSKPVATPSPTPTPPGPEAGDIVPGTYVDDGQFHIIQCGRPGQHMCHLCDLIRGFNIIIQYAMKIAVGVALLAIAIGGVMYIVSTGDTGMMDKAKKAVTNAIIGFVLIFSAYLIINTTITYLGTKPDLGINVTSWGNFDCNSKAADHYSNP